MIPLLHQPYNTGASLGEGAAVASTTPLPMDCRGYARSQKSTG